MALLRVDALDLPLAQRTAEALSQIGAGRPSGARFERVGGVELGVHCSSRS